MIKYFITKAIHPIATLRVIFSLKFYEKKMKYFLPALICAICGAWEIFLIAQGLRNQVYYDAPPMDTWQMVLFAIVLIALALYLFFWGIKERKKYISHDDNEEGKNLKN